MSPSEFRRYLAECDVPAIRNVWVGVSGGIPQPQSDHLVLAWIHRVRTEAQVIPLRLRAYSHRWLADNGYPSGLPDRLKPAAERLYPQVTAVVGISANSQYPVVQRAIHDVMAEAVLEAYADGVENPKVVKSLMMERRAAEKKRLFG